MAKDRAVFDARLGAQMRTALQSSSKDAAARELRDRWLEQVNSGRVLPEAWGKYEVGRALPQAAKKDEASVRLIEAA